MIEVIKRKTREKVVFMSQSSEKLPRSAAKGGVTNKKDNAKLDMANESTWYLLSLVNYKYIHCYLINLLNLLPIQLVCFTFAFYLIIFGVP
jgi:hypothetical protein